MSVRVGSLPADRHVNSVGRPTGPVARSTLVGRSEETEAIVATVAAAPALVVVEGEAGVGKTRLIHEAMASPDTRDMYVLTGGCRPLRDPFPMGPVVQALAGARDLLAGRVLPRLLGALVPLLPELEDVLPPGLESLGEAAADRYRIFRAIRLLIEVVGSTVLVIEDVHRADEQTTELLTFLLGDAPPGLRLVLSSRREGVIGSVVMPPHGPAAQAVVVVLTPLDRHEVAVLAARLLSAGGVSDEFATYLHERTAGVPFAVEQLILSLRDSGHLVWQDGQWLRATVNQLPVPHSVRAIIMQQLGTLSPTAQQLAWTMSVVDWPADQLLLQAATAAFDEEGVAHGLSELLAARLVDIAGGATYRLRHPLVRDAVYESLPAPRRVQLHLRVAQLLERRGEPLPLAKLMHHYRMAGQVAAWVQYGEAAIDSARSQGNDAEAVRLGTDILTNADLSAHARVRVAGKLADSAVQAVAHTSAVPLLRTVLAGTRASPPRRGQLRFELARLLGQAGNLEESRTELLRSLPDLSAEPGLAARAMGHVALVDVMLGRPDPDLRWLDRARQVAADSGDEAVVVGIEVDRASVLLDRGDPRGWEAAAAIDRDTTTTAAQRQQLRGHSNFSYAAVRLCHHARAESYLQRAWRLVDEGAGDRHEDSLESAAIMLAFRAGRWQGLKQRAEHFISKPLALPLEALPVRYVLGGLHLATGDPRKAQDELVSVARDAREAHYIELVPMALSAVVRLDLVRGRLEEALTQVTRALELVRTHHKWVDLGELAVPAVRSLLASARRPEAELLVRQSSDALSDSDAPAATAALHSCHGLLAWAADQHHHAVDLLALAERMWSDLGRPYDLCQSQELRAVCRLESGDRSGSTLLLDVLHQYELLGACWDASRVRHVAREHGISLAYRRGRKSYGTALSPRERQVAELAARGLTNREVAAELFISPRTAGDHVQRVMRKLRVASRRELPQGLAEKTT